VFLQFYFLSDYMADGK